MDAIATGLSLMAVQKSDVDWIDLTDGGFTTLHKHKGPLPTKTIIEKLGHPGGPYSLSDPFYCNSLTPPCAFNSNTYPLLQVCGYTHQDVDLAQFKISYRGVDHIGTIASPGDFTFIQTTHDYGNGAGPVPVTQWFLTLTTGGEGSNNIVAYGTAAGGDIDSDFWIVIVDNTPPVIVADWVVNPSYKNYKVDPNIFVGEYVNLSYVGSDAHWYRVFVPASGMTSTPDSYQTATSYTSGWMRTKSGLSVGPHTIAVRAYDLAGNYADASPINLNASSGPPIPAVNSFDYVDAGTPMPRKTAYYQELAGSSYVDNAVRLSAQLASALIACRNSGLSDRVGRFQSGSLAISTTPAVTPDWRNFSASGALVSSQASKDAGACVFYVEDQFYHSGSSTSSRSIWYNNRKASDYTNDPIIVQGYVNTTFPFNKAGYDAFADGVNVSNMVGCRVFDGVINVQSSTGSFEVTLDINENNPINKTHQIRISRHDTVGEIDWAGFGSILIAQYWNGSAWVNCNAPPTYPAMFGSGSRFFTPTSQTSIRIKLSWTAAIPDIEVVACLYIK